MNKAVFLDRDGVINRKAAEHDYIKSWQEFEFLPGIEALIRSYRSRGYLVVVITNQRGIARGLMTEADLQDIHRRMAAALKAKGAGIDAIYHCPHDLADNCNCRKPKPGMLLRAAEELDIELSQSVVIGDSPSDLQAGAVAGCKTLIHHLAA